MHKYFSAALIKPAAASKMHRAGGASFFFFLRQTISCQGPWRFLHCPAHKTLEINSIINAAELNSNIEELHKLRNKLSLARFPSGARPFRRGLQCKRQSNTRRMKQRTRQVDFMEHKVGRFDATVATIHVAAPQCEIWRKADGRKERKQEGGG